jgi:hypothetical protein
VKPQKIKTYSLTKLLNQYKIKKDKQKLLKSSLHFHYSEANKNLISSKTLKRFLRKFAIDNVFDLDPEVFILLD